LTVLRVFEHNGGALRDIGWSGRIWEFGEMDFGGRRIWDSEEGCGMWKFLYRQE
jgi:hypothetical protein